MKLAGITVTAFIAALLATIANASEISVTREGADYQTVNVEAAIAQFRKSCRPLGTDFWKDIENVSVEIKKEVVPARLKRGWNTSFHVSLKYADRPASGPVFASEAGVLAGQTLHYYLGGGSTPGYVAVKRSSQYMCGLDTNDRGLDVFGAVPALKMLDR